MSELPRPSLIWHQWEQEGRLPLNLSTSAYEQWLAACQQPSGSPADIQFRPWVQAMCYYGLGMESHIQPMWEVISQAIDCPSLGWELLTRIALRRGRAGEGVRFAMRGLEVLTEGEGRRGRVEYRYIPRTWSLLVLLLQSYLYAGQYERGLEFRRQIPDELWGYRLAEDQAATLSVVSFLLGQQLGVGDRVAEIHDDLYRLALAHRSDLIPLILLMYAVQDLLEGRLSSAAGRLERAYESRQAIYQLEDQQNRDLKWLDECLTHGWRLVSPFGKSGARLRYHPVRRQIGSLREPLEMFVFVLESTGRLLRRQPVQRTPTPEEKPALPIWLRHLWEPENRELPGPLRGWRVWHSWCQNENGNPLDDARLEGWLGNMGELGSHLRQHFRRKYETRSLPIFPEVNLKAMTVEKFLELAQLTPSSVWARTGNHVSIYPPDDLTMDAYLMWEKEGVLPADWKLHTIGEATVAATGMARILLEAWQLQQQLSAAEEEVMHLSRRLSRAVVTQNSGETRMGLPLTVPLLGVSPQMERIRECLFSLYQNRSLVPVLIVGESGTGKEVVARALHDVSPRRGQRFLALNCGGFSRELLASELFGYVKGAFTGANENRPGAIRQAEGGTLFLDEIGEMPLEQQPVLLRWLESGEVRPVGSSDVYRSDARLIAATNRNLMQMVQNGTFREDLLLRLKVLVIDLPPLRERREDIPILANYFLKIFREDGSFTQASMDRLINYHWPGNVRELRSVIQRTVALLPPHVRVIDIDHLYLEETITENEKRTSGAVPAVREGSAGDSSSAPPPPATCQVNLEPYIEQGDFYGGLDAAGWAMLKYVFGKKKIWEATYRHFKGVSRMTLIKLRQRFREEVPMEAEEKLLTEKPEQKKRGRPKKQPPAVPPGTNSDPNPPATALPATIQPNRTDT